MNFFEMFFGGNQGEPKQPSEAELKQEEEKRLAEKERVTSELNEIDLSPATIESLEGADVWKIAEKIAGLQNNLHQVTRPERDAAREAMVPPSESVRGITDETTILETVTSQSEPLRRFFRQLFDDTFLGCVVAGKFRENDMENWQEVFAKERAKGVTPFGDASKDIADFYEAHGIDLANPMPLDIEAFFKRKKYFGGNIEWELTRRREEKIPLNPQEKADVYHLFWKLFRVPDEKSPDGFSTLSDQELKEKMVGMKEKIG